MNIATVELSLERHNAACSEESNSRMSLTATADGFTMSIPNKTFSVKDRCKFLHWYRILCKIDCVNYIALTVADTEGKVIYESCNDLSDLTDLRKTAESNDKITNDDECDWDYDTPMVFRWYYANTILPFLEEVETTVNHLKKAKEIVGLECPVLSEPLTVENARKFSKCSHWICEKALEGIVKAHKYTQDEIKCPMCRQEHYPNQIESI